MPGRLIYRDTWLSRPGTASDLTPSAGTVQAWRTSAAVISIRVFEFMGIRVRLSTSNNRKPLSGSSS